MKSILTIAAVSMALVLSACASSGSSTATLVAVTAPLDKKGEVVLTGTGFAPDTEISLLFTTTDGVESDIGYALEPAPKSDSKGNWKTIWSYGRFVKKKLVSNGEYQLLATDENFNPLAKGTIRFTD
ncbi:hypothetical protein [Sneathiella aquimaris]|uniref:hypothetical protein n=1 Tax=Sneathiella aquimaris TaxID=2599305 RepID=UPI00146E8C96|nr:hypothetical protein [Sneathiella aquimaris]